VRTLAHNYKNLLVMISKFINNFKMPGFVKANILAALSDKNTTGIGMVHTAWQGIQKAVLAFPVMSSPESIQIEYKPICRRIQNSNLNKAYFRIYGDRTGIYVALLLIKAPMLTAILDRNFLTSRMN
jgi:hypothetical protein